MTSRRKSVALAALALLAVTAPLTPAQGPPQCVPKPRGLASFWRGEGDASDAIGPNAGVEQGAVTYADGMVGQAFAFDGKETIGGLG